MKRLILATALVMSSTAIAAAFPTFPISGEHVQSRVFLVAGVLKNETIVSALATCAQTQKDLKRINTSIREFEAEVKDAGAQNTPDAIKLRNKLNGIRYQLQDKLNDLHDLLKYENNVIRAKC